MDFRFTKEEEEFRREVRIFLQQELTDEVRRELESYIPGEGWRSFAHKLAAKGFLTAGWPKEYGGQARSVMERYILAEEMAYQGVRIPNINAVTMVGPTLMLYGSEEQKKEFLPRIARGEIEFTLGYTEPEAGSDLASLQIRAVEDRDDYVVSGQKRFSSAAHFAEYIWLAARTDPNAPKHKGISMFVVDATTPGITVRPLQTMGGRTNEVFWDNVRVPKRNLVGEKNRGFYYMATALDLERITGFMVALLQPTFDNLVQYVKEKRPNGQPLSKNHLIRHKLAEMAIELDVGRMLGYRAAWMVSNGVIPNYEASILKVFATELQQRLANVGMQILGLHCQLQDPDKWAPLRGRIEQLYRFSVMPTFGAGSNEIMRNIIAQRGLGLPR